jgi:dephospho-CoA kinase
MKKLGITGGIGSGKSIVSEIFSLKGIPVYDADSESKKLLTTNNELKKELINLLGEKIYFADGSLNKKEMAQMIFSNASLLREVNHIIHPIVGQDFSNWCDNQSSEIVATESALLFESGLYKRIDTSIMVYAPIDIRIKRAVSRDKSTREQIEARIKNQMDDEEKRSLSHYVIINDGQCPILPQIENFLKSL